MQLTKSHHVGHDRPWDLAAEALAVAACTAILMTLGKVGRKAMYPGPTSPAAGAMEKLWECLMCEGTYTCKLYELKSKGWDLHVLKDKTTVVICPECKETLKERKTMHEALKAGHLADRMAVRPGLTDGA